MTSKLLAQRETTFLHRPTYMDGETPAHRDVVMVGPLDRARYADVVQVGVGGNAGRVFLRYHDFDEPTFHWCSVDRCELVKRARRRGRS